METAKPNTLAEILNEREMAKISTENLAHAIKTLVETGQDALQYKLELRQRVCTALARALNIDANVLDAKMTRCEVDTFAEYVQFDLRKPLDYPNYEVDVWLVADAFSQANDRDQKFYSDLVFSCSSSSEGGQIKSYSLKLNPRAIANLKGFLSEELPMKLSPSAPEQPAPKPTGRVIDYPAAVSGQISVTQTTAALALLAAVGVGAVGGIALDRALNRQENVAPTTVVNRDAGLPGAESPKK